MSVTLAVEELRVETFHVEAAPGEIRAESIFTYDDYSCRCQTGDPCYSANPVCSHDCIEPSRRTNEVYCCG